MTEPGHHADAGSTPAVGVRAPYVELHCHSAFSLLDGASHPAELVDRAVELGYHALAITDHDELGGIVSFAQAGEGDALECIIGAEITVRGDGGVPHHLVLLAEDREGYGNLSTMITRARMDTPRGRPSISLDTVAAHAKGLFALTGCPRGLVPRRVRAGDLAGAREAAARLHEIFDGRIAIECWDHGLEEERALLEPLVEISRAIGVPWVVTNNVHYARSSGRVVHDVLSSLRHQRTLDEMGTRLRPNAEWKLQSPARMVKRWSHHPDGVRETIAIAERCAFRLHDLHPTLPAFALPLGVGADEYLERLVAQGAAERWGIINERQRAQLTHELSLIKRLGLAGFFLIVWDIVRFANRAGVLCQGRGSAANSAVCFCIGITAVDPIKLNLLFERFLSDDRREAPDIDIDFAHRDREQVLQYVYERYGREHAAMVCEQITYRGRSAVRDACRVLGFSVEQADTLAAMSDRFSARATAEAMQAEADVAYDAADRNSDAEHAERIGSHLVRGTEVVNRTRALEEKERNVRESEREERRKKNPESKYDRPKPMAAYEPYSSPNARSTSRELPAWMDPHGSDDHTERRNPSTAIRPTEPGTLLRRAGLDPDDARVKALPLIVQGMHNIPRHRSIHVGGFVLTKEPLATVVPIEPASMENRTVIQWEKDDVEAMGLVKIDLLGLGMLTLIQDCLKYINTMRGHTIDLWTLDFADQAVYDDLCAADTIGVFQVESRAQMNTLPRLKPRCFYDLVVEVALIRPGPIQGEMVHPYLRRKAGEEEVTYPHPSLEPILKRTLGVPLFQEQGMQVAIAAAGFTAGEADILRRAMGHKRSRERMADICKKMIDGMIRNGFSQDVAQRIYNQINAFADYGFPESHAASFALLVYASAYLKHYYAPEFLAAILNAQPMGFYSPGTLIEDAKRHGVSVLPVDASRSRYDTTIEPVGDGFAVRLGLRLVRGIGGKSRELLQRAVEQGGTFASIGDVVSRSGLDRRALRALAEGGALDCFVPDEPSARRRRAAVWRMLEIERGDAGPLAPSRIKLEVPGSVPAMSAREITASDYRMTGLSLNGHPMLHLRAMMKQNGVRTAREIIALPDGTHNVAAAGLVICRQRPGTAKGFVFLTLEDETGLVNVVVLPKLFETQALMISTAPLILVRGTLQVEQTVVNLKGVVFRELKAGEELEGWKGHDFH
ncbi:MAG: PHP domain-containing protein [Gemmatimonadaceae bacterium]|nr:PHP domain-containing protein [Gemmatimonadaceae bacterium]